MSQSEALNEEAAILARLDRSTPDALLKSIAAEFARLHEDNARLTARIAVMQGLSAMADRIGRAESAEFAADYPIALLIDADYSFSGGTGFHEVEYDSVGLPFRWTGPDRRFAFELFVDRREPADFALTFDDFPARRRLDELVAFVDGAPAALRVDRRGDRCFATGALPARADRGGTAIAFLCPQVELLKSPDRQENRQVGLRFRALAINPTAL
jgi:hypothetical protein